MGRPKDFRPRDARIRCERCRHTKAVFTFRRGSTICAKCERVVARAAAHPAADLGVTIRLVGDRCLRIRQLEGTLILTQGFRVTRAATDAVSVLARIHLPLRRIKAVQQALAHFGGLHR
jgi:ribosomal protein S27E